MRKTAKFQKIAKFLMPQRAESHLTKDNVKLTEIC